MKREEKFADIARQVSLCPTGKRRGNLGNFGRRVVVKEFEIAAFMLGRGEISLPVKTKFGYHDIRNQDNTANDPRLREYINLYFKYD